MKCHLVMLVFLLLILAAIKFGKMAWNRIWWLQRNSKEYDVTMCVAIYFAISRSPRMKTYETESTVHGHHVFSSIWSPTIGEQLAVAVMHDQGTQSLAMFWKMVFSSLYAFSSVHCLWSCRRYSTDLSQICQGLCYQKKLPSCPTPCDSAPPLPESSCSCSSYQSFWLAKFPNTFHTARTSIL